MAKIKVTKIEAAERQLNIAISLLFDGRDPVAIHTLSMAAFFQPGSARTLFETQTEEMNRFNRAEQLKVGKMAIEQIKRRVKP